MVLFRFLSYKVSIFAGTLFHCTCSGQINRPCAKGTVGDSPLVTPDFRRTFFARNSNSLLF